MNSDLLYLTHIGECIALIESYVIGGHGAFMSNRMAQDAVIRNLQVLAESTQRLSAELKSGEPDVDWRGIAGFRNILVHGYLGVDVERVWQVVEVDLPELKGAIERMRIVSDKGDEGAGD